MTDPFTFDESRIKWGTARDMKGLTKDFPKWWDVCIYETPHGNIEAGSGGGKTIALDRLKYFVREHVSTLTAHQRLTWAAAHYQQENAT